MFSTRKRLLEYGFLILMFCFAISLFNMAGYIFTLIAAITFLLCNHRIRFSSNDLLILLFSVSYFMIYWMHFGIALNEIILYLIGPWCAYVIAKVYVEESVHEHSIIILVLVLSIGMYLHGVLNIIAYVNSGHFAQYAHYRQSVDFWRNELVNVKTTEMLFTFATGLGLGVFFAKYKLKYKICAIVIVCVSMLLTIFMANRSLLIIFVVVLFWRLLCWLLDKHIPFIRKILLLSGLILILMLVVVAINMNVSGIGDAFYSMKVVQRFSSDVELTRFDVWSPFFKNLKFVEYPWGGKLLTQGSQFGYMHNMWLDVYNVTGILPFLFLIIITLKLILDFYEFTQVMKRENRKNECVVIQSLFLAIAMNMMVEPILEANPYYFLSVLMFWGAMNQYKKS